MPTRRDSLKSVTATLTAWLLPHRLFATPSDPSFHLLHADSQHSWPTPDPVSWAMKNQGQPNLKLASTGLGKLTENDGERIVLLRVRRCGMNLVERRPDHAIFHHWRAAGSRLIAPPFCSRAGNHTATLGSSS